MILPKNNFFKYFIYFLTIFLIMELILNIAYFILKDRSFYSYHLNKNATFTKHTTHGSVAFKPNILAHMPGYPDNLFTNDYGFIDNDNFKHNLIDHNKFNIFFTGGSTVEGRGSSGNKNTIPSYLERCLLNYNPNVQVVNAGFSGDFSYQEFMRAAGYIIPNFKVDAIIHLGGRNDAHNPFAEGDEWRINNQIYFRKSDYVINNTKLDCILCALSNKLNRYSISFYALGFYYNKIIYYFNRGKFNLADNSEKAKNNMNLSVENYINNVKLMSFYYKQYKIKFYGFIQPVLVKSKKPFSPKEVRYVETFAREYGPDYNNYINQYFNEIKNKNTTEKLIDISDIFKSINETMYFDTVHYIDDGHFLIAETICKNIIDKNIFN